jgi:hypothetical protein
MILDRRSYEVNLDKLVVLFKKSFNRQISSQFFKWRYLGNPMNELLICAEKDGESFISNYSASPVMMNGNNKVVKSALSMTTMTDPDYAGQGLFPKLAKELYEYMGTLNYEMIWGFPNINSHRGFINKLEWINVYEIPTMKLFQIPKNIERVEVTTDNNFDLDYIIPEPIANGIFVIKDKSYLKWRYLNHPFNSYENVVLIHENVVTSFCVIKEYQGSLDIIDFQAKDPDEGYMLLLQVIHLASVKNLTTINCWAPRHHFMHTLCEKLGFVNKEPITYLGFKNISGGKELISCNYSDWYLQMGDSDVF